MRAGLDLRGHKSLKVGFSLLVPTNGPTVIRGNLSDDAFSTGTSGMTATTLQPVKYAPIDSPRCCSNSLR